jgi:hypothetical protein
MHGPCNDVNTRILEPHFGSECEVTTFCVKGQARRKEMTFGSESESGWVNSIIIINVVHATRADCKL